MYSIEKTGYGFKLTFGDNIAADEMKKWLEESKTAVVGSAEKFQLLVDMRTLKPLDEDAQGVMQEGQKLYKESGMERSCVILDNAVTTLQFQRIAKETGIDAFERYIDASASADWMTKAMNWLTEGQEPN